jgi:hypothetical protein
MESWSEVRSTIWEVLVEPRIFGKRGQGKKEGEKEGDQ